MSEQKPEDSEVRTGAEPAAGATPQVQEDKPLEQEEKQDGGKGRQGGGSRFLRWLLVLLLLAALTGLVWLYQEQGLLLAELQLEQDRQEAALQAQRQTLSTLETTLAAQVSGLQQSTAEQAGQLEQQAAALRTLNQEVSGLRLGLAAGPGTPDRRWLLNEAASALRLGQQYLNLAGDAETALRLYQSADSLLRQINDPAITALRALLAADINLLQTVEVPDTEGLYLQLGAMLEALPGLNLETAGLSQDFSPEAPATDDAEGLLARLGTELQQYFTLRRLDEPVEPLLQLDDVLLIRQSLQLQLEQARLALLRAEEAVWQQSLAAAQDLLRQYAAADSQAQVMQENLQDLQATAIRPPRPALSNSLDILHDLLAAASAGNEGEQ